VVSLLPFPVLLLRETRQPRPDGADAARAGGLAGLSSAVQENISGIHVVKAYAAEAWRSRFAR
jgi:hypothetical protein